MIIQKGFTLIELIIAIFILSIGIVGIFGAYSAMVVATSDISNKFIANYLAKEGIEIVKNVRDINWGNNNPWLTNISDSNLNCTNGCQEDYTIDTAKEDFARHPWIGGDTYLNLDSNGFYSYGACATGTTCTTKFKRKITITCYSDETTVDSSCASTDIKVKVSVTVYWDKKSSLIGLGGLAGSSGSGSLNIIQKVLL
jgi:prepilin-type N-terminal cleavage/methylation domain-containing protein